MYYSRMDAQDKKKITRTDVGPMRNNSIFAKNRIAYTFRNRRDLQEACAPTDDSSLVYNETTTSSSHTPKTALIATIQARPRIKGRVTRKPIRSIEADEKLSTPQLLKFEPRRSWKNLKPHERTLIVMKYALLSPSYAFSLNFNDRMETKLKLAGEGARKLLSDEIRRRLKSCFETVPEISFVFEFDEEGRLHAHGVAVLDDCDDFTRAKFRQALKTAGGVIEGAANRYQIDVKPLRSNGWFIYSEKDAARTIELLGTTKIDYQSQSMSRLARREHQRSLARIGKCRGNGLST